METCSKAAKDAVVNSDIVELWVEVLIEAPEKNGVCGTQLPGPGIAQEETLPASQFCWVHHIK